MGNVSVLGDDDVVEVTWDLHAALLAVGPVSYTERLLHAWHLGPAVERVATACMSFLWCRSGVCFNVHGMIAAESVVGVLF